MLRNLLIIIGVIGLTVGAFFAYTIYFVTEDTGLLVEEFGDQFVGREVVMELEKIQAITLDDKLFQSATYQSLIDRSIEVADEPTGRNNPFAPIAGGVSSVVTVGSTTTRPATDR